MRRLLVASAALLGFAGTAYAGQLIEVNPSTTPPVIGDATGTPIPSPKSGFPSPAYNPDPGKIIIRLDGLLAFDTGFIGGAGLMQGNVLGGTPAHPVVLGSGKVDSFTNNGYFRLYFGADGQLMNGLRYGVNAEMRTNFAGATARGYAASSSPLGNASSNSGASLWFTRRAFGYIGTPQFGYVRFGQGDGPLSLFTAAGITTGESFSTGGWDGDIPDMLPAGGFPVGSGWMFNDIGNEYTSNKIVYLSPTFYGFNGAVSFAPNSCVLAVNNGGIAAGGGNCQQSSAAGAGGTLSSDLSRPRNIFEIAARWQGNAGPVAIDAMGGWQYSAVVNNGSAVSPGQKFKGVDAFDGGASLTWLGASIFGHAYGGQLNGTVTPVAVVPGRGSPKAWSAVGGAQYSVGPWTAGASYWYLGQEGSACSACGNLTFRGWAIGGDYTWAPGFDTFLEYIGGRLHQRGVNMINTGTGADPNLNNTLNENGVALTMLIRW